MMIALPVIQPTTPCVGYPAPCGRPATSPGAAHGVAGRLCARCYSRARRARRDAERPLGDCEAGCGRAAACRREIAGAGYLLCERCAERSRYLRPGAPGSRASRTVVPVACAACRTTAGATRVRGDGWGIPGLICPDCADDAKLMACDADDDPHAYTPTPDAIRRECAAIRAGWSDAERWLRTVPAHRGRHPAIHRLSGVEG